MKVPQDIIKNIVITEKSAILAETQNKYIFQVAKDSNKIEIGKAIESIFGVKVASVNTLNRIGKFKRTRSAKYGKRPDIKRAIVTLAEGSIQVI